MLGLITAVAAGAGGVYGHIKSRSFVGKKLRYTKLVERPGLGLASGVGATLATGTLVALTPFIGGIGIPLAIGVGVGTGVSLGVRDTKKPPLLED